MKKVAKALLLLLSACLALVLLYIAAAFLLSRISTPREETADADVTAYILTNGVHTDIVVPACNPWMDWNEVIPYANTLANDSGMPYLAIGWGDRGFYLETPTWADLKFSTAFKATTGLGKAAIHATYYQTMHEGDDCKKITLSKEQYTRLITYVRNSLKTDARGNTLAIRTNANYGPNDAFYEANGHYNLFFTCNTWTNNSLKSCGQKACLWTPFDTGILYQYTTH